MSGHFPWFGGVFLLFGIESQGAGIGHRTSCGWLIMDLNADVRGRMQERHGDAGHGSARRPAKSRCVAVKSGPRRHRANSLIRARGGRRRGGRKLLRDDVLSSAKDQKSQQVPNDQTSSGDSHSDGPHNSRRRLCCEQNSGVRLARHKAIDQVATERGIYP